MRRGKESACREQWNPAWKQAFFGAATCGGPEGRRAEKCACASVFRSADLYFPAEGDFAALRERGQSALEHIT
jgi:hypothetical protein